DTLVVQRTGRHPPKVEVQVRFLAGVLTTDGTPVVKRTSLHASTVAFRVRVLAGVLGSAERGIRNQNPSHASIPHSAFRNPNSALPLILWPRGNGASLTRRRAVVRVHPGSLRPPRVGRPRPTQFVV